MRIGGTVVLGAPRRAVFDAIRDPAVLMAVIPGCEAVEAIGPDDYAGRITLRLPGAVGTYRTRVRLVDAVASERAGMEGRVEGPLGSIVGHADFTLSEQPDGTLLEYRGIATIGGPLARLDARFAEHLAESLIRQALHSLDRRLAGPAGPVTAGSTDSPMREVSE